MAGPDHIADDGLETPQVRSWAEEKHRLVALYDRLFSTGMKNKWDCRVYIDLFAGAGHARITGTNRIVRGSPLIALMVPDKFDKYIFCEKSGKNIDALKQRVRRDFHNVDVDFIAGDCNSEIPNILSKIPSHSTTNTVLSLCFVDPYNIRIDFDTIKKLCAKRLMDFLMVLPTGMDATRNQARYFAPKNTRIARFLGKSDWRELLRAAERRGMPFRQFLAEEYASQMETLGYIKTPLSKMKEISSDDKNLSLYHLAFFSKNKRGYEFWEKVLRHADPQQLLGL